MEKVSDDTELDYLPGPAKRAGVLLSILRYFLSTLLLLLNPHVLRQIQSQLKGQRLRMADYERATCLLDSYVQMHKYIPPVSGEWMVLRGGITPELSHSWRILSQRYAYDFSKVDAQGRRHSGAGDVMSDYYCYGELVLAPADGVVVRVQDGLRDSPAPGSLWLDWRTQDICGNTITIDHGDGEFSFMAHLLTGSIMVDVGDTVFQGQAVALCGNSGHSTEPHLHFQIQDRVDFFASISLPIRFSSCSVNGGPSQPYVYLETGDRFIYAQTVQNHG